MAVLELGRFVDMQQVELEIAVSYHFLTIRGSKSIVDQEYFAGSKVARAKYLMSFNFVNCTKLF